MALAITRNVTISANENKNTLGQKMAQLVDLATFSGLDASNSSASVMIPYHSSVVPATSVIDGRIWQYNQTNRYSAVYGGSSTQKRWEPMVMGCAVKNATSAQRYSGDAICIQSSTSDLSADQFCTTGKIFIGALQMTTATNSYGLFKSFGKVTLAATGISISRGDFIKVNTAGSTYSVVSSTTVLDGSCGVALAAASGNAVSVLLWGHNKT